MILPFKLFTIKPNDIICAYALQWCSQANKEFCFGYKYGNENFSFTSPYSYLKLFTGFATAALIAWKLTVTNAIIRAITPDSAKTHKLKFIL